MRKRVRRFFNGVKSKTSHMSGDDPPSSSKLPTLHELESVIPKSTPDIGGIWQSKLPPDIILYAIEEFLENERSTVAALSSTCRSMYTICLPKRYNQVTLNSRNRISPTSIEAFARLAAHRPHILGIIQRLTFLDDGFMFQGSRPITIEEECLCYILTRSLSYAKLKRLDLSFRVVWDRLPPLVKSACLDIFSTASLDHISFHYMAIPANVLGRLSKISTIEMKGEVRTFIPHELPLPDDCTMWCAPKKLIIWDTSHTGFTTTNMLHKQSGLLLSSLEHLEARVNDPHFALLEAPLASCQHSLTHLELHCPRSIIQFYLGIMVALLMEFPTGQSASRRLQLTNLLELTSLVLSADCSMMNYGGAGSLSIQNFLWIVETMATLPNPRSIKFLTLLIRVRQFRLAAEYLPWGRLDHQFEPKVELTWPHLEKVNLVLVNYSKSTENFYRQGTVESLVNPCMPQLSSTDTFRILLSHEKMAFW